MDEISFGLPEACRLLGLGRTTLYQAIKSGELRALKAGRRTLISRQDLEDYLKSRPCLHGNNVCVSSGRSRAAGSGK
jgi:excisionase family DNA binding protein